VISILDRRNLFRLSGISSAFDENLFACGATSDSSERNTEQVWAKWCERATTHADARRWLSGDQGFFLIGAFDRIVELYGVKYDKPLPASKKIATYCWRSMIFPPSVGNTYESRTRSKVRSRPCVIERSVPFAMPFKLVEGAQKTWRRLDGQNMLPKLIANVKFQDGIEASTSQAKAAARPKRPSPKFGDRSGTAVRALIFGNPPERPGLLSTSRLLIIQLKRVATSGPAKLFASLGRSPSIET
jgi:hypothetical protein